MIFDYTPKGVCSKKMRVTLDDKNVIEKVEVLGGCSGNLQGISSLVVGMSAEEAIRRMRRSLEELVIEGYPTNSALAHLIMHDGEFVRGQYDTSFLDRNLPRLLELARTCDTLTAE